MIRYTQGNLLEAEAEAVVNTVNEVGVMGKGIALQFKEAFPASAKAYMEAAKRGEVRVGRVFVTRGEELLGPRWILHFPTKRHWRHGSKLEWVTEGLVDLVRVLREKGIRSVALPPLGCGNGGLDWKRVRAEIERAFAQVDDVEVLVYGPSAVYRAAPKRMGVEALTPARALIAELVRRYGVLGLECSNLEVQKLAWFLQRKIECLRLPDPLELQFQADRYGPYSDRLRHLLDGLDGSYLHCAKRLADAGPSEPIWFEAGRREDVARYLESPEALPFVPALEAASALIDGFESPLGMELLASVDWLLVREGCEPTLPSIRAGLARWPAGTSAAERKVRIFDERMLGIALGRLAPGVAIEEEQPN